MKMETLKNLTMKAKFHWLPFFVGLVSLSWYLMRTGTKPSRDAYPCQQVAKANAMVWLVMYIAPAFVALKIFRSLTWARLKLGLIIVCLATGSIAIYSFVTLGWWGLKTNDNGVGGDTESVRFPLFAQTASASPSSDVFAVNGTIGDDGGFLTLIDLMDAHGLPFYASNNGGPKQGANGLIARDDVVIIKVNSQWDERGGTNTDLLRALIKAIVSHPDGWRGEVVIADNGQAQYGSAGHGGSFDWQESNAEDHSQSIQDVVNQFSVSYRVSTYLWDTITTTRVREYSEGDDRDGYVVNSTKNERTGLMVSYPKFTTKYGTKISFKQGIWDASKSEYRSDLLKVLNVPVLKTHGGYGVTASVKHYMGVASDKLTAELGFRTHNAVRRGGMGTEMAETRFPTLNIIDAIWVNCSPLTGPSSSYEQATRLNVIAASTDPVALDAWAARRLLQEALRRKGGETSPTMDPNNDEVGSFGSWLRLSMEEMIKTGRQVNVDEAKINVHVAEHR